MQIHVQHLGDIVYRLVALSERLPEREKTELLALSSELFDVFHSIFATLGKNVNSIEKLAQYMISMSN